MIHRAASEGFEAAAAVYDRGRPAYPDQAIDWLWEALALAPGTTVVDVGAGTGRLSIPLAERGAKVIAVEPVAAMRARLTAASPGVCVREGTAEELPVAPGAARALVAGQAFHWFATDDALAEFARVLVPSGRLGLIWNRRQPSDPLQASITALIEPYAEGVPRHASDEWRGVLERTSCFDARGSYELGFVQELDRERLAERVASISFIAALPALRRAAVLERARGLVPAGETGRLGYRCEAFAFAATP